MTLHDENRMYKVVCFETLVDKNVEDTTKISSMYGGMNDELPVYLNWDTHVIDQLLIIIELLRWSWVNAWHSNE